MKTTAAVLRKLGRPLELEELEIPLLGPSQVLIETLYTGVCHTQLLEARGRRGPDAFLPHCLGHEGVGRVLEIGPGVREVKPGDTVALSWMRGRGGDGGAVRYRGRGGLVNAGPIATFMTLALVSEDRLWVLPAPLRRDLKGAAMLGCAAATGFGLVFNTLRAARGRSLAVFGLGGIGLCAVAAASAAGCRPIIAVDPRSSRRRAAREMGATRLLEDGAPEGVDYAVEATGRTEVMARALACVKARGGAAAIAGNAPFGQRLSIDPRQLNLGKRLLGSWGGDNDPAIHFPRYARLMARGRITLAPLTRAVYPLARVNDALEDLEEGRAVRPLLGPLS